MNKILTIFSIMVISNFSFSQSYTIEYEERANIENQLKHVTDPEIRKRVSAHLSKATTFYLYYNNGESIYIQEKESVSKNSEINLKKQKTKKIEIGKSGGGIYKNFKTKEYLHEADVLGKKLLVTDKLEKINWEFLDDEKTIGSMKCKKAKAIINNEEIIAWYNDAFALQDGPRDYYGLPGLIIELIAEKKTYHVINIKKSNDKLEIKKPKVGTKVSKAEYLKILDEKINELKRGIGNSLRN